MDQTEIFRRKIYSRLWTALTFILRASQNTLIA